MGMGLLGKKMFCAMESPVGCLFYFIFKLLGHGIFLYAVFFGNLASAREHCLAMLCKAECVSAGTGLLSTVMLDKSVEQKVVEEE